MSSIPVYNIPMLYNVESPSYPVIKIPIYDKDLMNRIDALKNASKSYEFYYEDPDPASDSESEAEVKPTYKFIKFESKGSTYFVKPNDIERFEIEDDDYRMFANDVYHISKKEFYRVLALVNKD